MDHLPPLPFELGDEYRENFWRFFTSQEGRFKLGERNIERATSAIVELGELTEKIRHEMMPKNLERKESAKDICLGFLAIHRQTVVYGQMEAMGRLLRIFDANNVNVFEEPETIIGIISYMKEMSARLKPQSEQEAESLASLKSKYVSAAQDSSGDESANVENAESDSDGTKQAKAAQKQRQAMRRRAKKARQKAKKKGVAKQTELEQPEDKLDSEEGSDAPASKAAAAFSPAPTSQSTTDLPAQQLMNKSLSDRKGTAQGSVAGRTSGVQVVDVQVPKYKNQATQTTKRALDDRADAFAAQGLKSAVPRVPSLRLTPFAPRGVAGVMIPSEPTDGLAEQIEVCASHFVEMREELEDLIKGVTESAQAMEKGWTPSRKAVQAMRTQLDQALMVADFMHVAFQHMYQMKEFEALAATGKQTGRYIKIPAPWTRTGIRPPNHDLFKEERDRRVPGQQQPPPPSYEDIEGRDPGSAGL